MTEHVSVWGLTDVQYITLQLTVGIPILFYLLAGIRDALRDIAKKMEKPE